MAVEKNYGSTLDILKTIYPTSKLHKTERTPRIVFQAPIEFGFETNSATKNTMLTNFSQAIENGLVELNDPDLIAEVRSYTLGDLMDKEIDPRITTRHFDLLMAACIAYQTNKHIKKPEKSEIMNYLQSAKMSGKIKIENPAR